MMRLAKVGVAAAALMLVLAGCSGGGAQPDSTTPGALPAELVLGSITPPQTLDANNMNWGNQSVYAQALFDTLVRPATSGVDVEPGLATEWSYNEDKTVLTLKLRDDVTFSDGQKFTADVAAQNLLRFRDGSSPQRAKAAGVVDATAVDATTLKITLAQADPAFILYLGQAAGLVESPANFTSADAATNPVGSGPYLLDASATVVGTEYKFTKNPDYWDTQMPRYENLTVKVFNDPTSLLNALRGNQLDASAINDNSMLSQVTASGYTNHELYQSMVGLYLFDRGGVVTPELKDVRVRQAINYAIDAEAFLKTIGLGNGKLTQQPFRAGAVGHVDSLDSTYSYDPKKAKQLLADAGYPNGFTLNMPSTAAFPQALFPLVQQQLADVGITVSYTDVGTNIISELLGAKYSVSYFQLQQDPEPSQLITFMLAPNATWNPFKYDDPKADELIAKVRAGGDDAKKAAEELNTYVVDQAWFNPWYTGLTSFVTDADTTVTINEGNAYPNLWNIVPAS